MADWKFVKLSTARQVAQLMDVEEDSMPADEIGVEAHYTALKDGGEAVGALDFIAHALPRFEGVAWAAHLLDAESRHRTLPVRDRLALDTVLRWLGDPDDHNRRAAHDAADKAGPRSAERYLAMAVFFSGGTISLPDLPPVNPPAEASARFAAGAVRAAAYRSDDPKRVIAAALAAGEAVATQGIAALAPA